MSDRISRRQFIRRSAVVAGTIAFLPRLGQGATTTTANDRLNVACIGVGGKGAGETGWCGNSKLVNLVAICDTDENILGGMARQFPRAKPYTDYRKMLQEMKEIEAVTVVTPDHSHFPAAMMAIQMGKHALVQKPLTHTVDEARRLAQAARDHKVATQMGNQGHSGEGNRRLCEYIWAGAIGNVTEVYASTDRPIWPQGIGRPAMLPVPPNLHWDQWLGPAMNRPYGKGYHPFSWRGFLDFGCGALGDMGCHILDGPVWSLKLDQAATVKVSAEHSGFFFADPTTQPEPVAATPPEPGATTRPGGKANRAPSRPAAGRLVTTLPAGARPESWPKSSTITYEFSAREGMPPCKLVWCDGGRVPPRPKDLEPERGFGVGGSYFLGDKGTIQSVGDYGGCRIIPEARQKEYTQPPKTIPRSKGVMEDWVLAAKGGPPASSNFDVSARLTEIVLLGNVALLAGPPGSPIEYDFKTGRITNNPDANRWLAKPYRKEWEF